MARSISEDLLNDRIIKHGGRAVLNNVKEDGDISKKRIDDSNVSSDVSPNIQKKGKRAEKKVDVEKEPKKSSYLNFVEKIYDNPTPTKEDLEKEEKRERSRSRIAMISDGISHLANMIGASKGALAIDPGSMTKTMSDKHQEFIDKRKIEEEKYKDALQRARLTDMNFDVQNKNYEIQENKIEQDKKNFDTQFEYRKIRDRIRDKQIEDALNGKNKGTATVSTTKKTLTPSGNRTPYKSSANMTSLTYTNEKTGLKERIDISKSMEASFLPLAEKIIDRMKSNGLETKDLDKNNKQKMITLISSNLHKYPDLNEELYRILSLNKQYKPKSNKPPKGFNYDKYK